jgi:hypothetical protein
MFNVFMLVKLLMHNITILLTCPKGFQNLDPYNGTLIILSRPMHFFIVLRDVRSFDDLPVRHAFLALYRV